MQNVKFERSKLLEIMFVAHNFHVNVAFGCSMPRNHLWVAFIQDYPTDSYLEAKLDLVSSPVFTLAKDTYRSMHR